MSVSTPLLDVTFLGTIGIIFYGIVAIFVLMIIGAISSARSTAQETISSAHTRLPMGGKYGTQEFYSLVSERIRGYAVPGLEISRISYPQGSVFSANREYLRISRKNLVFDICAAPFGKQFFVSFHMGNTKDILHGLILCIPFIGKRVAHAIYRPTFYRSDVEALYRETVSYCIRECIEEYTTSKGFRSPDLGTQLSPSITPSNRGEQLYQ